MHRVLEKKTAEHMIGSGAHSQFIFRTVLSLVQHKNTSTEITRVRRILIHVRTGMRNALHKTDYMIQQWLVFSTRSCATHD